MQREMAEMQRRLQLERSCRAHEMLCLRCVSAQKCGIFWSETVVKQVPWRPDFMARSCRNTSNSGLAFAMRKLLKASELAAATRGGAVIKLKRRSIEVQRQQHQEELAAQQDGLDLA